MIGAGVALSWLSAIPWRLLVAVAVLAALVGAHLWLESRAVDAALAEHTAAQRLEESKAATARIAAALEADREARRIEQARQRNLEGIERERVQRESRLRAAAAGARTELDGLRADLALRDAATTGARADAAAFPGCPAVACPERELFGACAGEYQGMAQEAGGLAGQVIELQAYVADVCRPDFPNSQETLK